MPWSLSHMNSNGQTQKKLIWFGKEKTSDLRDQIDIQAIWNYTLPTNINNSVTQWYVNTPPACSKFTGKYDIYANHDSHL